MNARVVKPIPELSPSIRVCTWRLVLLPLILLAIVGCSKTRSICTAEARFGLLVEVRDASTGTIPEAIGVVAEQGNFREELQRSDGGRFSGLEERPGTYTVEVVSPGYRRWERTIRIGSDECHVIPVAVTAELEPA